MAINLFYSKMFKFCNFYLKRCVTPSPFRIYILHSQGELYTLTTFTKKAKNSVLEQKNGENEHKKSVNVKENHETTLNN